MATEPTSNDLPPLRFSLRSMFFITTCVAVAAAGYAYADREELFGAFGAMVFLSALLTLWFMLKRRFYLASASFGWLALITLMPNTGPHHAARRAECEAWLRMIGSALSAYERANGALPPAYTVDPQGKPLHSWRTLILPDLDQTALFGAMQLNRPWNSPANRGCTTVPLPYFGCPENGPLSTQTSYLAVVGPNTAWPGPVGRKLTDIANPSKTILVIEVAGSGIQWAEPRDLQAQELTSGVGPTGKPLVLSHHRAGFHALFADGHVEFLPNDIDPQTLAAKFDISNPNSNQ